jgi:hypothetical protein
MQKKTIYNNNCAEKLLDTFMQERNMTIPSTSLEWDKLLELFFASVRQMNGDVYSTNGLHSLYYGIARVILAKYEVDIRRPEFSKSQAMIKNMKAKAKAEGHGIVKDTDIISKSDLYKIGQMAYDTPVLLQYKVWFITQFYYAKRGMEKSHEMKRADLIFTVCEDGSDCIHLADTATKNHRRGDNSLLRGHIHFQWKT